MKKTHIQLGETLRCFDTRQKKNYGSTQRALTTRTHTIHKYSSRSLLLFLYFSLSVAHCGNIYNVGAINFTLIFVPSFDLGFRIFFYSELENRIDLTLK